MANVILSTNRIRVRWSVRHVEAGSLSAVLDFLNGLDRPPRIVLEYFYGGWVRRIFTNGAEAGQCLNRAMMYRNAVPMVKPFVRRVSFDDVGAALPIMRKAVAAWDAGDHKFSLSRQNALSSVNSRLLVFSPERSDDHLIYSYLGPQAALTRFKGSKWSSEVLGKSIGRGVERYGRENGEDVLTGPYHEVLHTGDPRLDHVRACISRGNRFPEWVTYQRLLLPAVSDVGRPLVLCLAAKTERVDIPLH